MRQERKSRGAYLFVGTFDDKLVADIEQPTRCVRTVFDAIGELTTCSASDLVEVVVIDEQLVNHDPKSTIEALRKVDPTTIIVVAGTSSKSDLADVIVPINTNAARLTSAVANAMSKSSSHTHVSEIDLDAVLGDFDELVITNDSSQLGDVDLVRSLMHDPAGFTDVLVTMLKQQTGWKYCVIVDDASCAPDTAQTTTLRYGHEEYGTLAAIGATQSDLARWARWAACWLELSSRQRQLKILAYQDELSGAWNRRFLRICMKHELQIARAERRPLTVMIFDIDNFKHYNDQWGHDAGDEIIRELVQLLRTIIRKGDHVCRIGGDEFAVIFCDPEPQREQGSNHPTTVNILAHRFKEQVTKAHFSKLGAEATGVLTISGGLATFPWDGFDLDSILKKADDRLRHSKLQGKNSITIGRM